MTSRDLLNKLNDHSFRPFRIKMSNSICYDIREPWMIMVGESSAVVATDVRQEDQGIGLATDWKTVSIQHMMEFSGLAQSNGHKKKK